MDDEKRMKLCNVSDHWESIASSTNIHCLSEELLKEILLRLPDCKSVIQSKCVSRCWDALTSHPSFSVDFIRFKIEKSVHGTINSNNQHETFAFIMRYEPDRLRKLWEKPKFQKFFRPSIFQLQDPSFSPLHCLEDEIAPGSTLIASSQDLLLSLSQKNDNYDYYISNVQTRESVMLPSPPSYCTKQPHLVGFICDPFYSSGREIAINAAYNYSVVVICCCTPMRSIKFCAHIFSSYCDSQWCDKVLSIPEPCVLGRPCSSIFFSFCFDGKLQYCCREGFFGFDHSSIGSEEEIVCHLVKWPVGMLLGLHKLGVSQGRLHISAIVSNTCTLNVWVLEDYKAGSWMFQHSVELNEWVPRQPFITKKLQKFAQHHSQVCFQMLVRVLGFHPRKSGAIYLFIPGYILLCDLSTNAVELACRIPVAMAKKYRHYLFYFFTYPVILQTWPTPLPPLGQRLKVGVNITGASAIGL